MTDIKIPEGFTLHDGKGCPVAPKTIVQVMHGDLYVRFPARASRYVLQSTDWWNWANETVPEYNKIVAYRVANP